jgi:hypothetical protein
MVKCTKRQGREQNDQEERKKEKGRRKKGTENEEW